MKRWAICLLAIVMLMNLTACSEIMAGVESGVQDAIQDAGQELNKTVTRGTVSGDTYTSTYAGITFSKPSNWRYLTETELSEAMNAGAEILDQESFEQALASMVSVYDMMVQDDTTGNNIIVSYENLTLSNSTSITPEAYIAAVEQQLKAQTAFSITPLDKTTVTLSGNSYYRAGYTVSYSGVEMNQYYYVRKLDKYMHGIIVTVVDGTPIATVEAMFNK